MNAASCSPYVYDRVAHAVATYGMAGVFFLSEGVIKPRLLRPNDTPLEDLPLWGLDNRLGGRASRLWRRTSDIACIGAMALPMAVTMTDLLRSRCAEARGSIGKDALLMAETYVAVNLITSLLKLATRRHRPPACESDTPNIEYLLSFPSGHAATASCAATFAAVTTGLRSGSAALTLLVAGIGAVLAGVTSTGRIIGSMHYFSDVAGGTFLGTSLGFLLPWINRRATL